MVPRASVAWICSAIVLPSSLLCGPGLVTTIAGLTVHENVTDWESLLSTTVTVTVYGVLLTSRAASVPEITPVALSRVRSGGRPVVLYVRGLPERLVAEICRLIVSPSVLDWLPGEVTEMSGVARSTLLTGPVTPVAWWAGKFTCTAPV